MSLAVLASLWLAAAPAPQGDVILPSVMDLPVTVGVKDGPACRRLLGAQTADARVDCVDTTGLDVNAASHAYIRGAMAAGWRGVGGAANAYWLERARPDGTCERLDVAAVADFSLPADQALKGRTAVLFSHTPSASCRSGGR